MFALIVSPARTEREHVNVKTRHVHIVVVERNHTTNRGGFGIRVII